MKKKIILISIVLMIVLAGYSTLTPKGALRLGVLFTGHPIKALTLKISDDPYYIYTKDNQVGYSLENPPVEKATDSELVNWIVTKHGIFYTAEYYGWG